MQERQPRIVLLQGIVQSSAADRNTDLIAKRKHQMQVSLSQLHAISAFYIENTGDAALIEDWNTHFRNDALQGAQKRGVTPHIIQKYGFACADDSPRNSASNRDHRDDLLVSNL